MKAEPPIVASRVASIVGSAYLGGAVGYRVASKLGFPIDLLSPLFYTLPGALAGATVYAAWTGLRNRHQNAAEMVISGTVGVVLALVVEARLPSILSAVFPRGGAGGTGFFGIAVYELLCDLSAIAFLCALLLAGFAPLTHHLAPAPPGAEDTPRSGSRP